MPQSSRFDGSRLIITVSHLLDCLPFLLAPYVAVCRPFRAVSIAWSSRGLRPWLLTVTLPGLVFIAESMTQLGQVDKPWERLTLVGTNL